MRKSTIETAVERKAIGPTRAKRNLGLEVVDVCSRPVPAAEMDFGSKRDNAIEVLNRMVAQQGAAKCLIVDRGRNFTGRPGQLWAYRHEVRVDFSEPGKPRDNTLVETLERLKASVRARVEPPFRVIRHKFGHTKVCYRGLKKNTAQLTMLCLLDVN